MKLNKALTNTPIKRSAYVITMVALAIFAAKALLGITLSQLPAVKKLKTVAMVALCLFLVALVVLFALYRITCARDGGCDLWASVSSVLLLILVVLDLLLPALGFLFVPFPGLGF